MSNLEILKQHREALLLAEVAGLLHDVGKFCNLHIEAHSQGGTRNWSNDHAYKAIVDNPGSLIRLSPNAASIRKPAALNNVLNANNPMAANFLDPTLKNFLCNNSVSLFGETYTLAEIIILGTPGFATDQNRSILLNGKTGWLPAVLGVCHNEAHVDKEEPHGGQQAWPNVFISTAFGFEGNKVVVDSSPESLDNRLKRLQPNRRDILEHFEHGLGDTRQPINEVLLSDWAWIVASLLKSGLAGALIKNQQFRIGQWQSWRNKLIDHDLRWRLLRVNFDVLGLYAKSIKIADLLGYQEVINQACAAVKQLIEEEYPLGNEIYRDTTGIDFTFPDIDLPADLAQEIRQRIENIAMELAPRVAITVGDGATATEQLKGILAKARQEALQELEHPFEPGNLSPCWKQQWDNLPPGKSEVCPVCRLRPMQAGQPACQICLERRVPRAKKWLEGLKQSQQKQPVSKPFTIWIDEVADINGRLALIVGQFGLDDWLAGTMVQTLLVKEPQNGHAVPKNPSPARLRRIWETTRKFWQDVETTTIPTCVFPVCSRLEITPCNGQALKNRNLSPFHTYDLLVNGVRVSVVWDGNRFLTADNLAYLAKPEQLGKPLDQILKPNASFDLEEPAGYGSKNRAIGQVTIQSVQTLNTAYTPAIPLLAEPRTFMALVPADRALKVIEAIRRKYEVEMGKVRNRLPLTLGAVFFPRKTPLAAAIESGRRMLAFQTQSQVWQVQSVVQNNDPNAQDHHRKQTVELTLSCDGRDVKLSVPVMMGDGATLDVWYPYWRVEGKPTDRQRWFVGPDGEHWVHVCDLRQGDCVQFTPSTFDFEYLDTTARRFEVTYQHGQRRDPAKRQRPYLLEELDGLNAAWEAARRLSKSQIYDLDALIETKRQAWGKPVGPKALRLPADDPFRQLVRDALNETGLSPDLESAALRGWLRDALELHLEILKITLQLLETAR